jgi:hypothetical protein
MKQNRAVGNSFHELRRFGRGQAIRANRSCEEQIGARMQPFEVVALKLVFLRRNTVESSQYELSCLRWR